MKKVAAIFLFALFIFNILGYTILLGYLQDKSDITLEAQLDKGNYTDDELITIKIPVNLPYQTNWEHFERTDGEININGEAFKYVKRKVYNDTLILLCIRHEAKTEIQQKANEYFGDVNGLPLNSEKKAEVFKQLVSYYECFENMKSAFIFEQNTFFNTFAKCNYTQQFIPPILKPPQA